MKARAAWKLIAAVAVLASACERSPDPAALPTSAEIRRAVTVDAIRAHLQALQRIAERNGGNRAAGTAGHDESAAYVSGVLEDAGLEVHSQEFTIPVFEQVEPSELEVTGTAGGGPEEVEPFADGEDFKAMLYSASGDVEAPAAFLDFDPAASGEELTGAGCESSDFAGFPTGSIAVLQAGPCLRRDQVVNAQTAGAVAVVVSYPGWHHGSVRRPTLLSPLQIEVPALSASSEVGAALFDAAQEAVPSPIHLRVSTNVRTIDRTTVNVIAETHSGDGAHIVMVGGHLDSTMDGPGINDNGSGTAAILEVAVRLASAKPRNRVRFAFWSGEELGLLGSRHYVENLSEDERDSIALYLNLDMIASPNFVRFVYADAESPSGSEAINDLLAGWLRSQGLETDPFDLQGGSDHGSFAQVGIPVGGLLTGATEPKTVGEAGVYGGRPGAPADPCYHLACDTLEEIDEQVLGEMADAAAHAMVTFSTRSPPIPGS